MLQQKGTLIEKETNTQLVWPCVSNEWTAAD